MNYIYKLIILRDLVEQQISKTRLRPLKTAKEVLMLIDAVLEDVYSIEHFDTFGDESDVYIRLVKDENKLIRQQKIDKIIVGNKNLKYGGNFGDLNMELKK